MTDFSNIWQFDLRQGNSNDPKNGACLLDAVSWFEYGKLGDHPKCVCPVFAAFGRGVNDLMSDVGRQRLKVFIPRLIGTVDPASEQLRAKFLVWKAIKMFAPIALHAAGLHRHAIILTNFKGTFEEAEAAAYAAANKAAHHAHHAYHAAYAAAQAAHHAYHAATQATASVEDACLEAFSEVLKIGKQAPFIDNLRIEQANMRFAQARYREPLGV